MAQGRAVIEIGPEFPECPGRVAAAGHIRVGEALAQERAHLISILGSSLEHAAYGEVAGAAQNVVVHVVVVKAEVEDGGEEDTVEFLTEFRALGNDFAEGFRYAPAYVAALLGKPPLETAQHVARQVVAGFVELCGDGADSDSGSKPHLGFVHEQSHERSHG